MIEKLNIKKEPFIYAIISVLLLYLSSYNMIFALALPIFLSINLSQLDKNSNGIFLILSMALAIALDIKLGLGVFLPLLIYSLVMKLLIEKDYDDKKVIFILTSILSIYIFSLLGYIYSKGYIKIDQMTDMVSKIFKNEGLKIDEDLLTISLSNIPAYCTVLSLIYTTISLKLVRNYLNYKNENIRDLKGINKFRLDLKDLSILALMFLAFALIAHYMGISTKVIQANGVSILMSLLQINAILLIDFFLEKRSSKSSRIINLVLIIFLFALLSQILSFIGLVDVFCDLRKKVRL